MVSRTLKAKGSEKMKSYPIFHTKEDSGHAKTTSQTSQDTCYDRKLLGYMLQRPSKWKKPVNQPNASLIIIHASHTAFTHLLRANRHPLVKFLKNEYSGQPFDHPRHETTPLLKVDSEAAYMRRGVPATVPEANTYIRNPSHRWLKTRRNLQYSATTRKRSLSHSEFLPLLMIML